MKETSNKFVNLTYFYLKREGNMETKTIP